MKEPFSTKCCGHLGDSRILRELGRGGMGTVVEPQSSFAREQEVRWLEQDGVLGAAIKTASSLQTFR